MKNLRKKIQGIIQEKMLEEQWVYYDELKSMVDGRVDQILIEGEKE